jgi:hypothetical protein
VKFTEQEREIRREEIAQLRKDIQRLNDDYQHALVKADSFTDFELVYLRGEIQNKKDLLEALTPKFGR